MRVTSGRDWQLSNGPWRRLLPRVVAAIVGVMLPFGSAWPQWKPQKNVEIVAPSGPGSGIDALARALQRVLQNERLLDVTSTVVNRTGGGGTIAFNYVNQHAGDGHFLAVITPTLLTNHINKVSPLNYTDFTLLAQLQTQSIAFAVSTESTLKTAKDLLDRLKSDPVSVTFGTSTSRGNHNHAAIGVVGKAAGADVKKIKVVIFKSGGESMTAVLGGHVDVLVNTAGLVLPQAKAGKMTILAVSAPKRLSGALASFATWKEQGVNLELGSFRAVIGPRGMTQEQLAYWDDVLGRLARTSEWKRELDKQELEDNYMNSRDSARYWKEQYTVLRSVLVDLGLGG